MDKEKDEYTKIMNEYFNNADADLGFNYKKSGLISEKKVNVIKKIKKR